MSNENSFLEFITQYLASKDIVLPAFNQTGLMVQKEVSKSNPDVGVIERLIVSDQALTSQVLKMANSAFFKGLMKVRTIRNAVVRLGINEISNIVWLATQEKIFRSKNALINEMMQPLWRHSVGCAIGSQWLAMKCGFKSQNTEAFTAGLLHDMGKLFILTVVDSISRSKKIDRIPSRTLLDEVMINFHAEYGYTLLNNWNLPELYCVVARDHHLEELPQNDDILTLVRLANKACNKLGIGSNKAPELVLAATPEADYFGFSEISMAELEIKLEDSKMLLHQ